MWRLVCSTPTVGTASQVKKLFAWAEGDRHGPHRVCRDLLPLYALLERFRKRWLAVPLGCLPRLRYDCIYAMGAPLLSH
ncbi:DUF3360 family protein [Vibrio lentus]|nr:DUF3360 family protein [Vibrio lentus]